MGKSVRMIPPIGICLICVWITINKNRKERIDIFLIILFIINQHWPFINAYLLLDFGMPHNHHRKGNIYYITQTFMEKSSC